MDDLNPSAHRLNGYSLTVSVLTVFKSQCTTFLLTNQIIAK